MPSGLQPTDSGSWWSSTADGTANAASTRPATRMAYRQPLEAMSRSQSGKSATEVISVPNTMM